MEDVNILNELDRKLLTDVIKRVHDIFVINNIEYMADGGTLLGAVRHRGIIPWDDDADVEVPMKYKSKIESENFVNMLKENGLGLFEGLICHKIYSLSGKKIPTINANWPFVDIFFSTNNNGVITLPKWPHQKFYEKDVYPLKLYKFHDIQIYGPNNPIPYLDDLYGSDWKTVGKTSKYNHMKLNM